jgi:hypothetical protein
VRHCHFEIGWERNRVNRLIWTTSDSMNVEYVGLAMGPIHALDALMPLGST